MTRKVLIITYYWPPAGGAGVQRWVKFVKYLSKSHWQPIVYTVSNGEFPVKDLSFIKEIPPHVSILRRKIWEPYLIYKKITGGRKEEKINTGFLSEREKPRLPEKISVWIRGNFFIPDARKFWIRPSIRFLSKWLKNNSVDAIISTGPPHSMHLIALGLKKKYHLPWIADFRDPWTKIDFYHDLLLTPLADHRHHVLEKKVITAADIILSVNHQMIKDFDLLCKGKTIYMPNGFDPEDFDTVSVQKDKNFSIVYAGSLTPSRNPIYFWQAVQALITENKAFAENLVIRFIGHSDISIKKAIEKYGLTSFVEWIPYLAHKELIRAEMQASLLLLIINQTPNAGGIVTGKIFEYIRSGRPVFCLGPEKGEAAHILQETKAGKTVEHNNINGIKDALLTYFNAYTHGKLDSEAEGINRYSRKTLTESLVKILDQINS